MAYSWKVYRALFGGNLRGYVYARDEAEARDVWNTFAGITTYQDVDNEAALQDTHQANEFIEMEDAEFYVAKPEEGGCVIFLAPDELTEHIIDNEHVDEPHVFYIHDVEE